ncbi:hypothetical protein BJ166DRAFT_589787 [Pestalotiopsis sp. NC0098]|nr:hypothetical protein BJ166DRAFT_589787 [Pestalotiopsis sp. NC0098]
MQFSVQALLFLAPVVKALPAAAYTPHTCPKVLVDIIKNVPQGAGVAYCSSLLRTSTTATVTSTSYPSTQTVVSTVSTTTALPQVTVTSTSTVSVTESTTLTIPTTYTSTTTTQVTEDVAATTEVSTSTVFTTTTTTVSTAAVYPSPTLAAGMRKRSSDSQVEARTLDLPALLGLAKDAVIDLCACVASPSTVTSTQTQTKTAVSTVLSTTTTTSTSTPAVATVPATATYTTTETATTYAGPTETATITSVTTSYFTSSTTSTVTATATATSTVYQYALIHNTDNCAISYTHIVDYAIAGATEQQAIDNCLATCNADATCQVFQAYYLKSGSSGTPRCATFAASGSAMPWRCPVPGYDIGYSVAAQKNF